MHRTRTFDNHDMALSKQVSGSVYGLLDHERHENQSLPINPNFLLFTDKTLNSKLTTQEANSRTKFWQDQYQTLFCIE